MANNISDQLNRMKGLMNYGLTNESKQKAYSSVEYQREGADGKIYGIVREGTKFYIKSAINKDNLVKEDFDYIGGFRNRKDNEYSSYANAMKQFDLKMRSIREACNNKDAIVESWAKNVSSEWTVEATDKMKRELLRQRQIMENVTSLNNIKPYKPTLMEEKPTGPTTDAKNDPFQEKSGNKEAEATQKTNVSKTKGDGNEREKGKRGDEGYTEVKVDNSVASQKPKGGKVVKEEEVLGWNDNADYLDKSHGTEVGDSNPFGKKANNGKDNHASHEGDNVEGAEQGNVVEEDVMHQEGENQNKPAVGVGEIGDTNPFDEKPKTCNEETEDESEEDTTIEEALNDFGNEDDVDGEGESFGDDAPFGQEDFDSLDGGEEESPIGDEEEVGNASANDARMDKLESMLSAICDKLGIQGIDGMETTTTDEFGDGEGGVEDFQSTETEEEPIEDSRMYESKKAERMKIIEDTLNDFGKHPAYQKKVMELPPSNQKEKEGYYDMNDDSVKSEKPFGNQIGDGAPFEDDPQVTDNSIAEQVKRYLANKKKR